MMMVGFNGVNHLAMATGDMDSTIRFWRDMLGKRLVAGLGQPGYRHYFFEISENDLIAFFEGVDIRKNPQMKDVTPSDATKEGPEQKNGIWPAVKIV